MPPFVRTAYKDLIRGRPCPPEAEGEFTVTCKAAEATIILLLVSQVCSVLASQAVEVIAFFRSLQGAAATQQGGSDLAG
eukprot:5280128-Pyramimonas_sp.AAC.1